MTIADKIRQEGIHKVAKNAIIKGMAVEDIADLTGLTEKEIDEIRKKC